MGIEKEFGEQRNGGGAVQGIYLAPRLNCRRRKESVAGSDDHLGGWEYAVLAIQLRRGLLFIQPAALCLWSVVCGVVRGRSDAVEEWGLWRRK
jgi:hypothetical protein